MSYAVKKDGSGWRRVAGPDECSKDEIFQALAPLPKVQAARASEIKVALIGIDQKKIRAVSDAILNGDTARLQTLENQAQALREELATL